MKTPFQIIEVFQKRSIHLQIPKIDLPGRQIAILLHSLQNVGGDCQGLQVSDPLDHVLVLHHGGRIPHGPDLAGNDRSLGVQDSDVRRVELDAHNFLPLLTQ